MKKSIIIFFSSLTIIACNKQIDAIKPLTQIDAEGELSSVAGIVEATTGNYSLLQGYSFITPYDAPMINIGEGRGNNVTLQQFGPPTKQTDAFFFQNSSGQTTGYSSDFYRGSYQVIVGTNLVLEGIVKMEKDGFASLSASDKNKFLYAKGENLFLRALTYFNLIRVYGKPYYQDAATSSGVPLKKTSSVKDNPAPSTVKETYDFIINDLQQAAQLMKAPVTKSNAFSNTAAAWSLLSRVYLYMGGSVASPDANFNRLGVTYSDSVTNQTGAKYALLHGQDYYKMFGDDSDGSLGKTNFSGNKEIIFAQDNATGSSAGSYIGMIFNTDVINGSTATYIPSSDFKSLIVANDIRATFLKKNENTGYVETTKYLSVTYQTITYAPQIYFRLGEVYLNRAEANAKLGNYQAAKDDLKAIHTRAGLPASDIDNVANQNLLAAILKERRIELAFEGHASFDYFRNGLPMTRTAADNNGQAVTIQPTDPKVVFTIPNF
ncbi:RagB/SusD family nutrient uptake outer membrane protein [Pinibacter soli]|uniref:RagB/SusD family nutrient uptake outer membrane protein n=1 Tax=Pinibacter soli TaxID=3044211 RepID=A0ABT6RG63_9BACT|nr:RagB/SusD family nutrient uptake outer membrane protein [Pinibacter soli]MDI3320837.1 RagB/SusD family nutrient uptake outer membrane protein [Pinibacter soli]